MEILLQYQDSLVKTITDEFRRFLHEKIDWNQRMIGIKGPRGAGKTTLMLQYLKYDIDMPDHALYVTADHVWFYTHTLLETAEDWYQSGGRILFIDEVHKYPKWSRELKNIYDGYPDLQVIFSASSALDIYRGEGDLSRRVVSYALPGMSFREFLQFSHNFHFDSLSLENISRNARKLSIEISEQIQPIPVFKQYLKYGYLPIIAEGESTYILKLEQVINTVIDIDLAQISSYNTGTSFKIKKLLAVIAESAPFKPNISSISRKLDLSRDRVYQYIYQLTQAHLLNILTTEKKGISALQKPDKLYLENTNLAYALSLSPDVGNIRETFMLNQLKNTKLNVTLPKEGDFFVQDHHIEVGGKNKTAKQVKMHHKHLIAADNIETAIGRKVPLWLFGFLY